MLLLGLRLHSISHLRISPSSNGLEPQHDSHHGLSANFEPGWESNGDAIGSKAVLSSPCDKPKKSQSRFHKKSVGRFLFKLMASEPKGLDRRVWGPGVFLPEEFQQPNVGHLLWVVDHLDLFALRA